MANCFKLRPFSLSADSKILIYEYTLLSSTSNLIIVSCQAEYTNIQQLHRRYNNCYFCHMPTHRV